MDNTIINVNNYEIVSGTSFNNINTYDIVDGTSLENSRIRDNYLKNQIDSIIIAGISSGNVDILYVALIAVLDTKIGNQI